MADEQPNSTSVFDAVSAALNLKEFLTCALKHGVAALKCDNGSVFLVDGATETLHIQHNYRNPQCSVYLEMDEGVAGCGLKKGKPHLFAGGELIRYFKDWGSTRRLHDLRAIATIPVDFRGIPQAVFCFDFYRDPNMLSEEGLGDSEKSRADRLSKEIGGSQFANALNRIRINQTQLDIRVAGEGPARLRQAVADFLTTLLSVPTPEGQKNPHIAYLQLVDRRRGTIRTFQGVGMPMSFQTSISHSLDSEDVQAHVVRYVQPVLIVGKDPWMDPVVYDLFNHERFVRVWLPLFPFPSSRFLQRPVREIESLFQDLLQWDKPRSYAYGSLRTSATWNERIMSHPPSSLIFGTLELGYLRTDPGALSLEPLTPQFASWWAAQAYKLTETLFESTLPGSLDKIGKAVSNLMWPHKTRFTVAMPSWREPEDRNYPSSADWPAAVPETSERLQHPQEVPAKFEILPPDRIWKTAADSPIKAIKELVCKQAEAAARVALRLDDYVADLYTLVEESDSQLYYGTAYPDPKLSEILREICREATAERCIYFLFEKVRPIPLSVKTAVKKKDSWKRLGTPSAWPPERSILKNTKDDRKLAKQVAKSRTPYYEFSTSKGHSHPIAVVPIEITDELQAVIVLHFPPSSSIEQDFQRELEGRITRWVYRLSLRNLIVNDRFSRLMAKLRSDLTDAMRNVSASKSGPKLKMLSENFLAISVNNLKAYAGLLVLYSEPETAPATVERFWCFSRGEGCNPEADNYSFVGPIKPSPARKAIDANELVILQPGDPERKILPAQVNEELLARANELNGMGEIERASTLFQIVAISKEGEVPSTMVTVPVIGLSRHDISIRGALTLFLQGFHDFSHSQKSLLLELGRLLGGTLGQMRGLDSDKFEESMVEPLGNLRAKLASAETHDDVYGNWLKGIGGYTQQSSMEAQTGPIERWKLTDHSVVWLLAPGHQELVARSGRGGGLESIQTCNVILPQQHPYFSAEFGEHIPKKKYPSAPKFRIWTFDLATAGESELLQKYALLSGCKWLLSFPMMQADNKVIGVMDCLREAPFRPEEEAVMTDMLRRLSQQVCFALTHCSFERVKIVARELTEKVGDELDAYHAASVYQILVSTVQKELGAANCDLFLDDDGVMILHGTTRLSQPLTPNERHFYSVQAKPGDEILGEAMSSNTTRLSHGLKTCPMMDHISPKLQSLLAEDYRHGQLVIPLKKKPNSAKEAVRGLLHVMGPLSLASQGCESRPVRKSGLITCEHLRRAQDLAVVVYRNAVTARLVELTDWLIGELAHSLAQRLQVLQNWCDNRLRQIASAGASSTELSKLRQGLDHAFGLVNETQAGIAFYSKKGHPLKASEQTEFSLYKLIEESCMLMQDQAMRKGCRITYELKKTQPVKGYDKLLRSAVFNLLDNAIKYSYTDKEIEVTLEEGADGLIVFQVKNFGVGVPKPDLLSIFEPYFRSRVPDRKGARKGSGIGLAIVKHAIEVGHLGKVGATSTPVGSARQAKTVEEIAAIMHENVFRVILYRSKLNSR